MIKSFKARITRYSFLYPHVGKYKPLILWSVLAISGAGLLQPLLPAALKPLIDEGFVVKPENNIYMLIPAALVVIVFFRGVCEYYAAVLTQKLTQNVIKDLKAQLFSHQIMIPFREADSGGKFISRISYECNQIAMILSDVWIVLVRDILMLLGLLVFLLTISAPLTVIVVAILPIVAWLIKYSSRKMRSKNIDMQELNTAVMGKLSEAKSGLRDIKLYGLERSVTKIFSELLLRFAKLNIDTTRIQARSLPIVQLIATTGVAVIIYFAFELRDRDALTAGAVVSYIAALAMLFEPLRRLSSLNMLLQRAFVALDSIASFLRTPTETLAGEVPLPRSIQRLELKDASFRYEGSDEWTFRHYSLSIKVGDVIAIRGSSGSGKSTLSDLLLGFQSLNQGTILIDGRPIPSADLRRYFSVVSQSPVIFDGTVRQNLLLGDNAESERRALVALEMAALSNIGEVSGSKLLDHQVGEWGSRLSGGQRQRLALARAILRDAPILLIDEGTSALDGETEERVFRNILNQSAHKIVIFITHSEYILARCHRVINIEERE